MLGTVQEKKPRPRLTVELTEEQHKQLKEHLEHGMLKKVFSVVVDDIIRLLNDYGDHFIVAMLQKRISYKDMMKEYSMRNNDVMEPKERAN